MGVYNIANNYGQWELRYRINSERIDEDGSRNVDLTIKSPKEGFVVVLAVLNDEAKVIRKCDLDRPVAANKEYVLENCRAHRDALVFVVVTQTPVCFPIDAMLEEKLKQDRKLGLRFPDTNPTPPSFFLYMILEKHGHKWSAIAEISPAEKTGREKDRQEIKGKEIKGKEIKGKEIKGKEIKRTT